MNIKKGDSVVVISGKGAVSKGKNDAAKKVHEVIRSVPSENKVLVKDVNVITRHTKPKKMGQPGGRIKMEAPIDASNVMLYCSKCALPVRSRIEFIVDKNDPKISKKIRVCKKCGTHFDK